MVLKLDPRTLLDNPVNPRKRRDPAEFNELVRSMAAKGVLHPLLVFKATAGWTIYGGHRRRDAAIELAMEYVPCVECEPPAGAADSALCQLLINDIAAKHSTGERLAVFESYRAAHPEASNADLAREIGVDAGQITRYAAVVDGHPEVREAVETGLAIDHAYEINRSADPLAALQAHRAKPKARRGPKPKSDAPAERVNKLKCPVSGGVISISARRLDLAAAISLLKGLVSELKAAQDQNLSITTTQRMFADRSKGVSRAE